MKVLKFLFLCFLALPSYAQESFIVNHEVKTFTPEEGIYIDRFDFDKNFIVQFYETPSLKEQEALIEGGLSLLGYLPSNTYICEISASFQIELYKAKIRHIGPMPAVLKMSKDLHEWYTNSAVDNKIRVKLTSFVTMDLHQLGLDIVKEKTKTEDLPRFIASVTPEELLKILNHKSISNAELADSGNDFSLMENIFEDHGRSNYVANGYFPGLNFNGAGTTVAVCEAGTYAPNYNLATRLVETLTGSPGRHKIAVSNHGFSHGHTNSNFRGPGWGAKVYSLNYIPDYVSFYNNLDKVRYFNHSFTNRAGTTYTSAAAAQDNFVLGQSLSMNVWAAANFGNNPSIVPPYTGIVGFGQIDGEHQTSKNTFIVGSSSWDDVPWAGSSAGPVYDGRLSPQIVAQSVSGTSLSAPKVVGALAILSQKAKDMNGGIEANGTLLKNIIMNTADDIHNNGPDYKTGYGRMNIRKAHNLLGTPTNYLTGTVSQGTINSYNITIPANTVKAKILLNYADVAATPGASTALVNDLDLKVVYNGTTYLPWVLNPAPHFDSLNAIALRKKDNLNNTEQVTIDSPAAGPITVEISGYNIPMGSQSFWLSYFFEQEELILTYPVKDDILQHSVENYIFWDYNGTDSNPFILEYKYGNGPWQTIASVSGDKRAYNWTPPMPANGHDEVMIRISRNGLTDTSETNYMASNMISFIPSACDDQFQLQWTSVPNAIYKVYKLVGNVMTEQTTGVTITGNTAVIVPASTPYDGQLYAVTSTVNGIESRKSLSTITPIPDYTTCIYAVNKGPRNITKDSVTLIAQVIPRGTPITNIKFEVYDPNDFTLIYTSPVVIPSTTMTTEVRLRIPYDFASFNNIAYSVIGEINGVPLEQITPATGGLAPGSMADGNGSADSYFRAISDFPDPTVAQDSNFSIVFLAKTSHVTATKSVLAADKIIADALSPGWAFTLQNGNLGIELGNGLDSFKLSNITFVADGKWHQIAATFDRSGEAKVYIDGVLKGSQIMANLAGGPISSIEQLLTLFTDSETSPSTPIVASIDEFRMYYGILSSHDLFVQMHHPLTSDESDLFFHWQFDFTFSSACPISNCAGTLNNFQPLTTSCAPLGLGSTGYSDVSSGLVSYGNSGIKIEFNAATNDTIIASSINCTPVDSTGVDANDIVIKNQFWITEKTSNSALSASLHLKSNSGFTAGDQNNPSSIKLYQRIKGSCGNWELVGSSSSVTTADSIAIFSGITTLDKEFLLTRSLISCGVVNNTNDDGPQSLRAVIACASSGDAITFAPSILGQTIDLISDLIIDKDIQIVVPFGSNITIRANSTNVVNTIKLTSGHNLLLENLKIIGGTGPSGAAILNMGNLTLKNVVCEPSTGFTGSSVVHNSNGAMINVVSTDSSIK